MQEEKGTISVHTENIFPIIKKFLYSDHEIFLRELVSNAVDATQKLHQLASAGEFDGELGETKVRVSFNAEAKTITVSDHGVGMTADEIKKYINQIAFSGATEFVEQYKDKGDAKQIIGHFGMGFYSSFMVADRVEIITRSYREGAEPARWSCDGSTEFEITPTVKKERGTDIVLHIAEDSTEFLDKFRLRQILDKYGRFLPVPIEFEGEVINDTTPVWTKTPTDLKDEDYLDFYKKLYPTAPDPLFWVHLNVDYPFHLTGVLYFPKVPKNFEFQRDKIQLYSRQVFITDEVKDVVPEFLMLLHGVIDSPDIPLNVSRSYLQSDANVKKINGYIARKVGDRLHDLFKEDRASFEEKYESLDVFVKYGMISDEKFYDRGKKFALLANVEGKHFTLDEYVAHVTPTQKSKDDQTILLYTTDPGQQDAYVQAARDRGLDVLRFDGVIDAHFINTMEQKLEKVQMKRVDADPAGKLIDTGETTESVLSTTEQEAVRGAFETTLDRKGIQVEALAPDDLPVLITLPEFMRRMKDMARHNGMNDMFGAMPDQLNVVVNGNHPLVGRIAAEADEAKRADLVRQAYDLALLSQNMLQGKSLTEFIRRSAQLI
ncbi:MAG: molecular chaperone HtpG [Catalinimonas sp.]